MSVLDNVRFGLTALGEQQDIDPDKVARILSHAL